MKLSPGSKYAARSLWRNPRRTILSVLGIGLACGVALIDLGIVRGEREMYGRAAGETGRGHLTIAPGSWLERRDDDLRLTDWERELAAVRALPGVRLATPRQRLQALLAMGNRLQAVELVGVDPVTEQPANRFVRKIVAGRYLLPEDRGAVVIGTTLAERLRVELDDELVVTAVRDDGEMESALLRIVGLATSGSREIDGALAHVVLPDAEKLSGRPGAGEIAILLDEHLELEAPAAAVRAVASPSDTVLDWMDVTPELRAGIQMDEGFARITISIIMLVVLLGVAAAQLAAVLERRKELAVLAALGMKSGRIMRALLLEAVMLGLTGTIVGLAVSAPLVWHWATHGLDLRAMYDTENMVIEGIMADFIMYADFGWWIVGEALLLCVGSAVLASLYPAWFASRTNPADALRVAQ